MLAVRNDKNVETEMEVFSADFNDVFSNGNIFDAIDLDDLFNGINGGDLLPDLEMYPEFTVSGLCEDSEANFSSPSFDDKLEEKEKDTEASGSASELGSGSSSLIQVEEIVSKPSNGKGRKSSKNRHGKKKLKVDWTPELHKRFVEAVEQLGVDKAVPSRILEIMGTDCLTRHNIASHLQKYRSQQKHRLARKAVVVSQSHGWQLYDAASLGKTNVMNPWIAAPTMGFPPLTPSMTHFRPLHVWGHPPSSQPLAHTWPKHVSAPPGAPNSVAWSAAHHPSNTVRPPPVHPSFWQTHNNRFSSNSHGPRVPMPQEMYKAETKFGSKIVLPGKTLSQLPSHVHPSKESVDAAIGDVLSKPWMPLPLGLKPPSTDSVMVELQRKGISNVPPTRAQ